MQQRPKCMMNYHSCIKAMLKQRHQLKCCSRMKRNYKKLKQFPTKRLIDWYKWSALTKYFLIRHSNEIVANFEKHTRTATNQNEKFATKQNMEPQHQQHYVENKFSTDGIKKKRKKFHFIVHHEYTNEYILITQTLINWNILIQF